MLSVMFNGKTAYSWRHDHNGGPFRARRVPCGRTAHAILQRGNAPCALADAADKLRSADFKEIVVDKHHSHVAKINAEHDGLS